MWKMWRSDLQWRVSLEGDPFECKSKYAYICVLQQCLVVGGDGS